MEKVSQPYSAPLIDLVVERGWNIGLLAEAMEKAGFLNRVYGGFPAYRYTQLGIPSAKLRTWPVATVWNQLARMGRLPSGFRLNEPSSVGNWVARHSDLAPIINCNGTAYRYLFPRIKSSGRTLVIERGSMHPEDHFLFQERAKREAGFPATDKLSSAILDEIEKEKLADFVVCGSEMIRDSYTRRGFPSDRVIPCHYGIDHDWFSFANREPALNRPLRLATIGVIGLRKGILRLIRIGEWAKSRGIPLELWLIGPIEPAAQQLLEKTNIPWRGFGVTKRANMPSVLHQADLYAMCSYEEGFPLAMLEAMSTGLGVIASNDTGGREAIDPDVNGVILSDFNEAEFDAILAPLLRQPARLVEMGAEARRKIESNFTILHYNGRIKRAYEHINQTCRTNRP
jgi:glycosyltransferase involved in cell wall biosynthesis